MSNLYQSMDLHGRRALVTGGAGHVGRMVCDTLASLGCNIGVLDLPSGNPDAIASNVASAHGVTTEALAVDLSDHDALRAAVEAWLDDADLEIVVHCAALVGTSDLKGWNVPFEKQDNGAWQQAMAVNLESFFTIVQTATAALRRSGHGSIISIGSIYGNLGPDWRLYEGTDLANPAAYAASKGGLRQFTRWLATTLAPDVRANSITPGGIERGQPGRFQQQYVQRTPLGRMANEYDLAGAIAFLASDLSAYVTGHDLIVDGGWSAW